MRVLYPAAVVLACLLLLALQPAGIEIFDEGVVLTGGMLVVSGKWPGLDFYATYGPLHYLAVGWVNALSDGNLLASRVYLAAVQGLGILGLTLLLEPWRDRLRLAAALGLAVALTVAFSNLPYPTNPSRGVPTLCAAFVLAMTAGRGAAAGPAGALRVLGAGLVLLLPLAFLRPVLALVLLAGLAAAAPFHLANHGALGARALGRHLAGLSAAAAVALAGLLAYDAATGGALRAFFATLDAVGGMETYARFRGLPFPTFATARPATVLAACLPILVAAAAGAVYLVALVRPGLLAPVQKDRILYLLVFTGGLYSLNVVATNTEHVVPSLVVALALAAQVAVALIERLAGPALRRRLAAAGIALAFPAFAAVAVLLAEKIEPRLLVACDPGRIAEPPQGCLRVPEGKARLHALLRARLDPGEPFLSANTRHDTIFRNDMASYALVGHPPLTYWAQMDPGVTTTAAVQQAIVADLEAAIARRGRALVLVGDEPPSDEPNESRFSSGVTILDARLAACETIAREEGAALLDCRARPDPG